MPMVERVESLRTKHQHLDEELRYEETRPLPDTATVRRLKQEKLRIKDEIERLARH